MKGVNTYTLDFSQLGSIRNGLCINIIPLLPFHYLQLVPSLRDILEIYRKDLWKIQGRGKIHEERSTGETMIFMIHISLKLNISKSRTLMTF